MRDVWATAGFTEAIGSPVPFGLMAWVVRFGCPRQLVTV